jgi:hypothetical protein
MKKFSIFQGVGDFNPKCCSRKTTGYFGIGHENGSLELRGQNFKIIKFRGASLSCSKILQLRKSKKNTASRDLLKQEPF